MIKKQTGKTLIGEVGLYGTFACCAKAIPVAIHSSVTFSGKIKKPDACTVFKGLEMPGKMYVTHEPSSYINVRLGVTSAVSESIDLNADVKASFANDYYEIMGAVCMSNNF